MSFHDIVYTDSFIHLYACYLNLLLWTNCLIYCKLSLEFMSVLLHTGRCLSCQSSNNSAVWGGGGWLRDAASQIWIKTGSCAQPPSKSMMLWFGRLEPSQILKTSHWSLHEIRWRPVHHLTCLNCHRNPVFGVNIALLINSMHSSLNTWIYTWPERSTSKYCCTFGFWQNFCNQAKLVYQSHL